MTIKLNKTATYRDYLRSKGANVIAELTYYKYLENGNAKLRAYGRLFDEEMGEAATKSEGRALTKREASIARLRALYIAIKRGLANDSKHETSDQWRKSRKSIEVRLRAAGLAALAQKVNKIENPTPHARRVNKPKRRGRVMRVTAHELNEIIKDRDAVGDEFARSMLILGWYIGMRPSEVVGIKVLKRDERKLLLEIPSAKKLANPNIERGLDRKIWVDFIDANRFAAFGWALATAQRHLNNAALVKYADKQGLDAKELNDDQIEHAQALYLKALQQRLNRMSRRMFPRRTTQFCMYSLRYNMGSLLKKMYRDAGETKDDAARFVSAVLGHRNMTSSSCYGNYASGQSAVVPVPLRETLDRVVDNRHGKRSIAARKATAQEFGDNYKGRKHADEVKAVASANKPGDGGPGF